jgi:hypothetical protein
MDFLTDSIHCSLLVQEIAKDSVKPVFTSQLPTQVQVDQNGILHLECNVEPKEDPKLNLNWYHNGLPLSSASRIKANNDFGFVTLDISDMSARDEGVYTCKAINQAGEAVVFTTVECGDKSQLDLDTKHPKGIRLRSVAGATVLGVSWGVTGAYMATWAG